MNIIQITPGAGGMYCGGCFRDNAMVAELRRQGHETLMVPLYLPLTLDEKDQSAGTPTFFGGIGVYLEQKSSLFRHAPRWFHRWLASPTLLKWASGRAAKTRAADVGDLTLSMLRGEEGNQSRDIDELVGWLQSQPKPDVICLSNALLIGMARELKRRLGARIVCLLAGEDSFLDGLPGSIREQAWSTLTERARDVDLFLPPSRYYSALMGRRLSLRDSQLHVLPNGINTAGYEAAPAPTLPTLGYFARMCPEKGLDTVVDAFITLKRNPANHALRLHVGGGCGPGDEPYVETQRRKLGDAGVIGDVQFFPNVDHAGKIAFFRGLSVLSTPARYGEAFGLYLIEALAAGVPVVQPRTAAFPEIIEATGGGVLCEPENPGSLAQAIDALLNDPAHARELGAAGRQAVGRDYTIARMAGRFLDAVQSLPR